MEPGKYYLKVRGICKDKSFYVASIPVDIKKTVGTKYKSLETKVKDKWEILSLEQHILASGAFRFIDIEEQAFDEYTNRPDSCINSKCTTKLNALTLAAFRDNSTRQKMHNTLDAWQNHIRGKWKLQIETANSGECNLTINNITEIINLTSGINTFNLSVDNFKDSETISIFLDCDIITSAKIVYSYKDLEREFEISEEFSINNKGCWGNGFKTNCTKEATTYALLALAMTGKLDAEHSKAVSWLEENAESVEAKAVLFYIIKDSEILTWLLEQQSQEGWWSKIPEIKVPDIRASSLVALALKSSENKSSETLDAITKVSEWLISQNQNIENEAFMLFFAFQSTDIEPILAFWPGLIKTQSLDSFNLILLNQGINKIDTRITMLNSTTETQILVDTTKSIQFSMPLITTSNGTVLLESLFLDYHAASSTTHYSYSIPLLIFTQKTEVTNETIEEIIMNITEEEINETIQEEIINETKESELENKTTELNESLLQKKFYFVEEKVTATAKNTDLAFTRTIRLANELDRDLYDITISRSSALIGIVEVEPSYIEKISRGRTTKITIKMNPSFALQSKIYEGYIQTTASYDKTQITTEIPISINISVEREEKTCAELGGKKCEAENEVCEGNMTTTSDTYSCCIPAEACKSQAPPGRNIGLIIVLIIMIVLIVLLLVLRRKPKKEMKEFLEKSATEYEKRFQRPSIIR